MIFCDYHNQHDCYCICKISPHVLLSRQKHIQQKLQQLSNFREIKWNGRYTIIYNVHFLSFSTPLTFRKIWVLFEKSEWGFPLECQHFIQRITKTLNNARVCLSEQRQKWMKIAWLSYDNCNNSQYLGTTNNSIRMRMKQKISKLMLTNHNLMNMRCNCCEETPNKEIHTI